jgi:methionyl-tRNA formyltransferase
LPATYIHNRVRGLYPWPHAYTYIGTERLIVLTTRLHSHPEPGVAPGTIVSASGDGLRVATGHGGEIAVLQVQPEGRRAMPVRDFLGGHALAPGTSFGSGPS